MWPPIRSLRRTFPTVASWTWAAASATATTCSPRETVGVDISPEALEGQERETVVADMRDLPFEDHEFDGVLSVQSLEHVPDPEKAVAQVARPEARGTAVFVTPNRLTLGRPDEIIDPYHFREFDHEELGALCRQHFAAVEIRGIFGSPRYMEIVNEERAKMERVLSLDPLRLRRLVPIKAKQWLYGVSLRRLRSRPDPRSEAIEVGDFELRDDGLLDCLDVVAICKSAGA
ncbi:MAG: class I SAM-dependent methyltransferase [Acidimicrobiales bacterium]